MLWREEWNGNKKMEKAERLCCTRKRGVVEMEKQAFCFCKGELVDCIPGRVQDCNMKNVSKCPLDK